MLNVFTDYLSSVTKLTVLANIKLFGLHSNCLKLTPHITLSQPRKP